MVSDVQSDVQRDSLWNNLDLPSGVLFGTDGIRGKAGDLLTAPLALNLGYWAGVVLQGAGKTSTSRPAIILGRDSRTSGTMLGSALAAGLGAAGVDVWDLGMVPTPVVSTLTHLVGAIGGIMISASHNPPEDNGIKFFGSDGGKLAPQLQQQIEAALRGKLDVSPQIPTWGQHVQTPELVEKYFHVLQAPLTQATPQPLQGLKVVLDLAYGAATSTAAKVFSQLGAELVCLHEEADGDRINVNCGSTHLGKLREAVLAQNATVGFAFDGDADRVLAVDAQGRIVDGDYILYFWGKALMAAGQLPENTIVSTVMSNLGFERAWTALGGKLIRAAVGDQYVQAEMNLTGAMLGGEQSGHILCPHYAVSGDGLMTALHVASLIQTSGKTLAQLVDDSFQTYPQVLHNVRVEDRNLRLNWQDCEALQGAIAQAEEGMGDRGRILVRASGTEPLMRVMVEAETMELVEHWTRYLVEVVERHFT
jgi:phosphoglucosamine mutase